MTTKLGYTGEVLALHFLPRDESAAMQVTAVSEYAAVPDDSVQERYDEIYIHLRRALNDKILTQNIILVVL